MTEAQLKALFRQLLKPLPGGPPVGTPGANRAEGVLLALDALAKEIKSGNNGNSKAGTLSATTLNVDVLVGNKYKLSPDLKAKVQALIDAGEVPVWIIPDTSAAARTTVQASSFGVDPNNSAADNADGVNDMRTSLLG